LIESNPGSAPVEVDKDFRELRQVVVKHMLDEVEMASLSKTFVLDNCISVKDAAEYNGYISHYKRRLLRLGKLAGLKLGQAWLIDKAAFEAYLKNACETSDRRFGTKNNSKS
jgi:excisionase family DNA binding protein